MSEKDQIHTLLTELAGEDPPIDIDLDRQIQRGQRRVRRRTVTLCVAAVAVSAVAVGGIVTFRPDANGSDAPIASPGTPTTAVTLPDGTVVTPVQRGEAPTFTPTTPATPRKTLRDGQRSSTAQSRALLVQLRALVPELTSPPGVKLWDEESVLRGVAFLDAGGRWDYPGNTVDIHVSVGPQSQVEPVCEGTTGINACTEIRHLPDGSIAYLHGYILQNTLGHSYEVRLDHPGGLRVSIDNVAWKTKPGQHDAELGLERVLEIARKITVRP
jgi:hypothetical protein